MNKKKKILLHACCAACVTVPYQRLSLEYDVDVYFYNPNIHPDEEYRLRMHDIERLAEQWGFSVEKGSYDKERWLRLTRGFEKEPERGARCTLCYQMRLEQTARVASERGYHGFTTTLTLSPMKNAVLINRLGEKIGQQFNIPFIKADFKKKEGYKKSIEISRQENLYRQNYCGCVYSRK